MPTAPLDTLESVVNTARSRLNDAIVAIGGEIFTDNSAFGLTAIIAAWRRTQEYLASRGFQDLIQETIFKNVTACASPDQGQFVWFNWTQYFDGNAPHNTPVFPQNMIYPIAVEERIGGTTGNFTPVDQCFVGLPTVAKGVLNLLWEWRNESIYMPGATGPTDIRLRFAQFLPDFVSSSTDPWNNQPVPIMRVLSCFAWFICSEVARPRGDMDAGYFDQQAIAAAELVFGRDYQPAQQVFKPAELAKMPDQTEPVGGQGRGQ